MAAYNYYQVGGSLRYKHPTYIERQADRDIYEGLKNGEFCYVLNSRQMGKSSLRVRMMKTLKEEGIKCASIDIGRLGSVVTPEEWYGGIVSELWRGFSLSTEVYNEQTWWQQQGWLSPVLRLSRFIEDVLLTKFSQDIVIFIDEIDSIIKIDFKEDFFTFIRTCYNQRVDNPEYARLTFCLLGVATPSNLIQDKKRTPFNVGRAIELTGFTVEEARFPLTRGLKETVDNPDKVLEEVLYWTGGQPFLTQKLCQLIVQKAESKGFNIQQLIQKYVIDNWEVQDEPEHLRTIRDRILSDGELAIRLLERYKLICQYGEVNTSSDSEEVELQLSGLVVKQTGKLRVYNPIYERVFNLEWIDSQLASLWLFWRNTVNIDNVVFLHPSLKKIATTLLFCASFLAISAISLLCSYEWFSSIPWQMEFGENGAIIEFNRSVIFAIGTLYMLGIVWRKEVNELIHSHQLPVRKWRKGFVIATVIIFVFCLYYHLISAPLALKERSLTQNYLTDYGDFRTYFLPYLLYLPYTLINYNILALAWVVVSSYGAVKDLAKSSLRTNCLQEFIGEIEEYFGDKSATIDTKTIETLVEREFHRFSFNFITLVSRYTIFFLSLSIIILFEAQWGIKTLSQTAQNLMLFAYLFNVMALIIILWAFSHYHTALRKSSICLFKLQCNYQTFEAQNSVPRLLKKILNYHFNLYLVIGLAVIYLILSVIS